MNELTSATLLSLRIALIATVLAAVVAVPLAALLAKRRFWGKSLVESVITVPLVLPPTVTGYLILIIFGSRNAVGRSVAALLGSSLIFSTSGAVLAAAVVALPLLYLPSRATFASVDRELIDVARIMGAGRLQVFWHVMLPLARSGIASGLVLAFARSLGEFGATVMVLGIQEGKLTLPILIYRSTESIDGAASAGTAVAMLLGVSLGLVVLYNHAGDLFGRSKRGLAD